VTQEAAIGEIYERLVVGDRHRSYLCQGAPCFGLNLLLQTVLNEHLLITRQLVLA